MTPLVQSFTEMACKNFCDAEVKTCNIRAQFPLCVSIVMLMSRRTHMLLYLLMMER